MLQERVENEGQPWYMDKWDDRNEFSRGVYERGK